MILELNNSSLTSQLAANQRTTLSMTLSASRYIAPLRIMSSFTTFHTPPPDPSNDHLTPIVDTADDVFPFDKLPPELRVKIWQGTFTPRTVVLDAADINIRLPRTPNPVTLSVCKESRVETLKYYQVIFTDNIRQHLIYFNPNLDSLTSMTKSIMNETVYSQDEPIAVQFQSLSFLAKWTQKAQRSFNQSRYRTPIGALSSPAPNACHFPICASSSSVQSSPFMFRNLVQTRISPN